MASSHLLPPTRHPRGLPRFTLYGLLSGCWFGLLPWLGLSASGASEEGRLAAPTYLQINLVLGEVMPPTAEMDARIELPGGIPLDMAPSP